MKEERYHLALDKYDKNIVLNALNTLRTQQIQEERPTEPVDELISRVAYAPTKKVKSPRASAMKNGDDYKAGLILSLWHYPCRVACPADSPLCQRRHRGDNRQLIRGSRESVFHNGMGTAKDCPYFLLAYGMGIGVYFSTRRNYRKGRNTALQNGATQALSIKSTEIRTHQKTSC